MITFLGQKWGKSGAKLFQKYSRIAYYLYLIPLLQKFILLKIKTA